jgi:hypothetical protein
VGFELFARRRVTPPSPPPQPPPRAHSPRRRRHLPLARLLRRCSQIAKHRPHRTPIADPRSDRCHGERTHHAHGRRREPRRTPPPRRLSASSGASLLFYAAGGWRGSVRLRRASWGGVERCVQKVFFLTKGNVRSRRGRRTAWRTEPSPRLSGIRSASIFFSTMTGEGPQKERAAASCFARDF